MKQSELLNQLENNDSLNAIQNYIKQVIDIRGFGNETVEQKLLLLLEEVGELAKSVRKDKANMSIDKEKIQHYDSIESEIADVFIVLTAICNVLHINLYRAIIEKEKMNVNRTWVNINQNNS